MLGTIAITDDGWYNFLRQQDNLHEVNFWTPSARRVFHGEPFSPFLFKLKSPKNAICGYGFFARYTTLPDWLAWDSFGQGNGCQTLQEMRDRIDRIRERIRYTGSNHMREIGCILIVEPIFFPPDNWVHEPKDWPIRTQSYKRYDLKKSEGARIWNECLARSPLGNHSLVVDRDAKIETQARYGSPITVQPRLGQGTFRVAVLDAYERACAITYEHSLPALEAGHIRPYRDKGPHDVRNGLLLRADLHRLFDQGYMTVTPDLHIEISPRLREDYKNGHTYYPLHGHSIHTPRAFTEAPAPEFLTWHNEKVFLS